MGIENDLMLIGSCDEPEKVKLDQLISSEGIRDQIHFVGRLEFDGLVQYLKSSDFFIFPSANSKEGHSNSLTEAMAFGVIPIVSTAGFNREIVGDDRLVAEELNEQSYADRVREIIQSGKADELRSYVMKRVRENYTETIVTERLIATLQKLDAR